MNQVADILALARDAQQENVDTVLATVVRTEGSAYRRAGAMMLICEDGRSVGMISGGCLEPHIIKRAFWLTRQGATVQVYQTGEDIEYTNEGNAKAANHNDKTNRDERLNSDPDQRWQEDTSELDEMNFGLGCNGRVHVLFERLASAKSLLETITQVRRTQQPMRVATLIRNHDYQNTELPIGMRINLEEYHSSKNLLEQEMINPSNIIADIVEELGECKLSESNTEYVTIKTHEVTTEWLVQRLQPQIRLLVCGAGNDVMPLVTMAKLQDWHVTVIDSRAQYATRMRFPQADVVMPLSLDKTDALLKLSKNAAVALMSHSLSQDRARLAILLAHPKHYKYIGQLGPRYRTERLIDEIGATKTDSKVLAAGIRQLHYPIGYKLGGDGPEALALGIMAQINAVMHQQASPAASSNTERSSSVLAHA